MAKVALSRRLSLGYWGRHRPQLLVALQVTFALMPEALALGSLHGADA